MSGLSTLRLSARMRACACIASTYADAPGTRAVVRRLREPAAVEPRRERLSRRVAAPGLRARDLGGEACARRRSFAASRAMGAALFVLALALVPWAAHRIGLRGADRERVPDVPQGPHAGLLGRALRRACPSNAHDACAPRCTASLECVACHKGATRPARAHGCPRSIARLPPRAAQGARRWHPPPAWAAAGNAACVACHGLHDVQPAKASARDPVRGLPRAAGHRVPGERARRGAARTATPTHPPAGTATARRTRCVRTPTRSPRPAATGSTRPAPSATPTAN